MMRRGFVFILIIAALAGSARAILPPDAKAREPQLRAYRQRLTDNYEKRQIERQEAAVRAHEQTLADIFIPPWMRNGAQAALETDSTGTAVYMHAPKRNHRFLVSIVLLILIGVAAGLVRYITRELDE